MRIPDFRMQNIRKSCLHSVPAERPDAFGFHPPPEGHRRRDIARIKNLDLPPDRDRIPRLWTDGWSDIEIQLGLGAARRIDIREAAGIDSIMVSG